MNISKNNLSAYRNYLHSVYERYAGVVKPSSVPYFMAVDPSSICNLKCPFCPTGIENHDRGSLGKGYYRKRALMPLETFDAVIDELGEYIFFLLLYNWGEPLLNKNLPAMVRKAKLHDIYTQVHTNLSLKLTDDFIKDLMYSGLDEICISIDGMTQEVYEKYRRGGDLRLVLSNLERLVNEREKSGLSTTIEWGFLVFSYNEKQIKDIARYCKSLGINFRAREADIDTEKQPDWVPDYKARIKTVLHKPISSPGELVEKIKDRFRRSSSKLFAWWEPDNTCIWHYGLSVINADGMVSPCCIIGEKTKDFGEIIPGERGFRDVWNNANFTSARSALSKQANEVQAHTMTVCNSCNSTSLKNLYGSYAYYINKRLIKLFSETEPILSKAVRLVSNKKKFITYYRENILNKE